MTSQPATSHALPVHFIMANAHSVSQLLDRAREGDQQSLAELLPLVYRELRALASSYLGGQRGHTLQPTALVHEAIVKLIGPSAAEDPQPSDTTAAPGRGYSNRDHFMAVAATAMRQILVDHARRKSAQKRGGKDAERLHIDLNEASAGPHGREMRILELDDLLKSLARVDERAARGAEMRLFGGMEQAQIALVLGISRTLVATDWQFARAWLAARIGAAEPTDA